jgi:hypothetical protein
VLRLAVLVRPYGITAPTVCLSVLFLSISYKKAMAAFHGFVYTVFCSNLISHRINLSLPLPSPPSTSFSFSYPHSTLLSTLLLTAFRQVAVKTKNRLFRTFLMDALFFSIAPYHTVTALGLLTVFSLHMGVLFYG